MIWVTVLQQTLYLEGSASEWAQPETNIIREHWAQLTANPIRKLWAESRGLEVRPVSGKANTIRKLWAQPEANTIQKLGDRTREGLKCAWSVARPKTVSPAATTRLSDGLAITPVLLLCRPSNVASWKRLLASLNTVRTREVQPKANDAPR